MAQEQVTVAPLVRMGAKIGGASMVVGLVSVSHAFSHAYGALLPLVLPSWREELQMTYAQIGLLFTLSNLVWGPLQLGFGILGRVYSRKGILGLGHVCQGLTMVGTALAQSFGGVLTWRLLSRVADAPQHPIGNALIAQSFAAERRGLGFALNTAGANLGTVAVPALGGLLMATFGWRSTLALFGLVGAGVGALLLALLDEPRTQQRDGAGRTPVGPELWALVRQRDAVLLLVSHVIGAGGRGFSVATLYVPLYLSQTLNMDQVQLGGLLTIMMIGSVVGPLLAGPLSDRLGRKPILLLDAGIACLCFAGLLLVSAYPWALIAVLVITGLAVYSEGPVMQTALAEVAAKTSMEMLFGLYFTIGAVMSAPWALVLGALVDRYGFPVAFAVMGASQIVAGLCILPVRLRHTLAAVPLP